MFDWVYRKVVRALTRKVIRQFDVSVDKGAATVSIWLAHDDRYAEDFAKLVCTGAGESSAYDMDAAEFNRLVAAVLEVQRLMKDRGFVKPSSEADDVRTG